MILCSICLLCNTRSSDSQNFHFLASKSTRWQCNTNGYNEHNHLQQQQRKLIFMSFLMFLIMNTFLYIRTYSDNMLFMCRCMKFFFFLLIHFSLGIKKVFWIELNWMSANVIYWWGLKWPGHKAVLLKKNDEDLNWLGNIWDSRIIKAYQINVMRKKAFSVNGVNGVWTK